MNSHTFIIVISIIANCNRKWIRIETINIVMISILVFVNRMANFWRNSGLGNFQEQNLWSWLFAFQVNFLKIGMSLGFALFLYTWTFNLGNISLGIPHKRNNLFFFFFFLNIRRMKKGKSHFCLFSICFLGKQTNKLKKILKYERKILVKQTKWKKNFFF